jgi:lysophospholipase L1-like esterase
VAVKARVSRERFSAKSMNIHMKKLLWIMGLLGVGLDGQELAPAKPSVIAMVGDSLTRQGDWRKVLERDDVINWGIPGYTTGQLEWTFKDLIREQPGLKVVFLSGGTNDLLLGVPADRIFLNQTKAVTYWRSRGIVPVLQSVLLKHGDAETNAIIRGLNARLAAYCAAEKVGYLNLNPPLSHEGELRAELTKDGTHLKPEAYPLWAALVREELARLGY